jgi:hypothetical protein
VLDRDDARNNQFYLGRSRYDTDPWLDARRDVRLYSIALTDQQVRPSAGTRCRTKKTAAPRSRLPPSARPT